MPYISVTDLVKEFRIYHREKGFVKIVGSLFHRKFEIKRAVDGVSFGIERGELVGYVGPNGAGKSTTIKMLSGILLPTSGEISVAGLTPHKNRQENALRIGVVFGQRSQLFWDLPVYDTFELYRKMYRVEPKRFERNVAFYTELLGMGDFLRTPVRQLSLGQKMRANIAIALLHDPEIVYLDEPTIGLDVMAKDAIRRFIREVNKEKNITLILTTHDVDDIEQICDRLIMIDHGRKIYDGSIVDFKAQAEGESFVEVLYAEAVEVPADARLRLAWERGLSKSFAYRKSEISTAQAIAAVTRELPVADISLKEPQIEEIIKGMYAASAAREEATP